jgi:hypothetical protein
MGELLVHLPGVDRPLPFSQALALGRRLQALRGECHWHFNECGCCVTVHGPADAWVIDAGGGETHFAKRGCECS